MNQHIIQQRTGPYLPEGRCFQHYNITWDPGYDVSKSPSRYLSISGTGAEQALSMVRNYKTLDDNYEHYWFSEEILRLGDLSNMNTHFYDPPLTYEQLLDWGYFAVSGKPERITKEKDGEYRLWEDWEKQDYSTTARRLEHLLLFVGYDLFPIEEWSWHSHPYQLKQKANT